MSLWRAPHYPFSWFQMVEKIPQVSSLHKVTAKSHGVQVSRSSDPRTLAQHLTHTWALVTLLLESPVSLAMNQWFKFLPLSSFFLSLMWRLSHFLAWKQTVQLPCALKAHTAFEKKEEGENRFLDLRMERLARPWEGLWRPHCWLGRFLAFSSNTEAVASTADALLASQWSSITNTVHSPYIGML